MSSLYLLGDVWLPNTYITKIRMEGEFVFNMESPITNAHNPAPGKINLKAEENHIMDTFGKNPIAVCLANNHIMDHGVLGLKDTISSLEQNHIRYFGCGTIEDNCNNPTYLETDGLKIALLGYVCPSTNPIFAEKAGCGVMQNNYKKIQEDILAARLGHADRIIVCFHWGAEEVYQPKPEDIKTARGIIDVGADIVIGHHSHCVQPIEIYKGKHIFYGLGNCIMPDINIPCYYNEKGMPTGSYNKIQKRWNRYSLLVDYSPSKNSVRAMKTHFNGYELKEIPCDTRKLFLKHCSIDEYAKQYKYSAIFNRLKTAFVNYLMSPKVLRLKHIQSIFSILKNNNN